MATSHQIEDRIDRERAGSIALNPAPRNMLTIAPSSMADLFEFSKLMAVSGQCIPQAFRDKPGACLAIALQAFRTGADPFAVANKAYLVNDRVAYEAQYIHAVINTSGLLKKRLRATYEGEGQALRCTVRGEIHGEDEPFEYRSPTIAAIPVKNSPLWKGDPEQQLFYYASRAWARRYAPEVILGMDTGEDIESRAIDVTPPPKPRREDFVKQEPLPTFVIINEQGEEEEFAAAPDAVERIVAMLNEYARTGSRAGLEICFDNNDRLIADLQDADKAHLAREIEAHYRELVDELRATAQSAPQDAGETDHPPDPSLASPASHQHRNGGVSTASGGVERLDVSDAGSVSAGSSIPLIEPAAASHPLEADVVLSSGESVRVTGKLAYDYNHVDPDGVRQFVETAIVADRTTQSAGGKIIEGLKEAVAHARGESADVRITTIMPPRIRGADAAAAGARGGRRKPVADAAQIIPERATVDDPRPKPPEEADADAVDGAGSRSEAVPAERGGGSATHLDPRAIYRAEPAKMAGGAGGSPAIDIVGELGRKLTAAAQQGQKALDQAWLRLSEQERDLARPMRAQYREIAAQVRQ